MKLLYTIGLVALLATSTNAQEQHFVNNVSGNLFEDEGDTLKAVVVLGFDTQAQASNLKFKMYGVNYITGREELFSETPTPEFIHLLNNKYYYKFTLEYTPDWYDYGIFGRLPEFSRYEVDLIEEAIPDTIDWAGWAFNHGSWFTGPGGGF